MLPSLAFAALGVLFVAAGVAELLAAPRIVDAQLEAGVTGPDRVALSRGARIAVLRGFGATLIAAGAWIAWYGLG